MCVCVLKDLTNRWTAVMVLLLNVASGRFIKNVREGSLAASVP